MVVSFPKTRSNPRGSTVGSVGGSGSPVVFKERRALSTRMLKVPGAAMSFSGGTFNWTRLGHTVKPSKTIPNSLIWSSLALCALDKTNDVGFVVIGVAVVRICGSKISLFLKNEKFGLKMHRDVEVDVSVPLWSLSAIWD